MGRGCCAASPAPPEWLDDDHGQEGEVGPRPRWEALSSPFPGVGEGRRAAPGLILSLWISPLQEQGRRPGESWGARPASPVTGILRVSSSYVNLLGLSPKCGPRILGGRRGLHLSPLKATSVIPVTAPGYAPRTSEMGVACAGPRSPVSSLRAHSPAIQSSPVRAIVKPDPALAGLAPFTLELVGGGSVTSTNDQRRRIGRIQITHSTNHAFLADKRSIDVSGGCCSCLHTCC